MNVGDPIATPPSLVDRVKNIILHPKEEWPRIDAEPATIGGIYTSYVLILAAIPAIAGLIGGLLVGYSAFGITYKPSAGSVVSMAIVQYILALVGVFVLALIIDWLAPSFGGVKDQVKAFKVSAYSMTAAWLAGIFAIIPALGFLGLLGLYSLYLLYLGLPLLMKAPAEKAMSYTVVTIIAGIIIWFVIAAIAMPVSSMFGGGLRPPAAGELSGTVNVPGVGAIDVGKVEAASKQMEAQAQRMKDGTAAAIDPSALQALLPESIGAYRRTSIESASMGAGAIGGSHAEARYEAGGRSFKLEITDMAAAGALAAMGAAMNVNATKQDEDGYEKTKTVDGRLVTEKWDNGDKDGTFSTTVANRFMVSAEGQASSIDELKAAVSAIGLDKLAGMAG